MQRKQSYLKVNISVIFNFVEGNMSLLVFELKSTRQFDLYRV